VGLRAWLSGQVVGDDKPKTVTAGEAAREADLFADEDRGWRGISGGPRDVPYWTLVEQMADAAEAYRQNPLAFRIVELTTDYALGRGVRLQSPDRAVQAFVDAWWSHPQNRMAVRQFDLCTELSLAGELFVALNTNPFDGMTYLRPIPAALVDLVETDPQDVEVERRFHQVGGLQSPLPLGEGKGEGSLGGRWWEAEQVRHYAINRLVGTTRGQGDLVPLLPWLRRYKDWLTDRVRMNKFKGAFLWDVELRGADRRAVLARQAELATPPTPGSIVVHNEGEVWKAVQPAIDAQGAEPDGRAMRLMVAAGAGLPLHFLAEAEGSNRATAAEMGGPTLRHFERRQLYLGWMFADLALEAVRRSGRFGDARGVTVEAEFEDLSARENVSTAAATRSIVSALAEAAERGWVDDATARRLIAKYSGEPVPSAESVPGAARAGGRVVVTRGG
jgi:hypothetical protein